MRCTAIHVAAARAARAALRPFDPHLSCEAAKAKRAGASVSVIAVRTTALERTLRLTVTRCVFVCLQIVAPQLQQLIERSLQVAKPSKAVRCSAVQCSAVRCGAFRSVPFLWGSPAGTDWRPTRHYYSVRSRSCIAFNVVALQHITAHFSSGDGGEKAFVSWR